MDSRQSLPDDTPPDVAEILADLRAQIRERRSRFTEDGPDGLDLDALRHSIETVNDTWFVSAHLPITWDVRLVGRLGAYAKRIVRVLLRWYINPIVEQQNRYNSASARAIVEMYAYQERMVREWHLLEERVAQLEGDQ